MISVAPAAERIYVGMDVSRDKIAVAVLRPGEDVPAVEVISHDGEMVRRLIGRFADRSVLAACYEAGPGGYELYRLLASMGVACDVVAPALIPKAAADRVKTDPLTELPEGIQQLSGRMGILVATVTDHDHRRRCAAGPVPAGDAAGRVA